MTTAWAHLPNAKHIDRILAAVKKDPGKWGDIGNREWISASDPSWDAANNTAWSAAWSAASGATYAGDWNSARCAILALISYDDCAYLLDEKPEHVQILALLGNNAAILIYLACVALQYDQ